MDNSWLIPVLAVLGLVVVGVVVVGGVVMLAGGAWFVRRGRGPDPHARDEALAAFGYRKVKEGQWSRPIQGTTLTFDDGPERLGWTVRLPRYNTMTLRVEERAAGVQVPGAFDTGDADLDARFVLGSSLAARTQALLGHKNLRTSMLAVPNLSLDLGADELVVKDPGRAGLRELLGGAEPGTQKAIDAELELHQCVANLVNAFFRSLYTETGTVFDEHR